MSVIYHHKIGTTVSGNATKYFSTGFNNWGKPVKFRSAYLSGAGLGIPQDYIRYAKLYPQASTDETGAAMDGSGQIYYETDSGIPCASLSGLMNYRRYRYAIYISSAYTLSVWMKATSSSEKALVTLSGGHFGSGGDEVWILLSQSGMIQLWNGGASDYTIMEHSGLSSGWHHIACVWTGSVFRVYVDKIQQGTDVAANYHTNANLDLYINTLGRASSSIVGSGKYAALRLYNYALDAREISALAKEFTPIAN